MKARGTRVLPGILGRWARPLAGPLAAIGLALAAGAILVAVLGQDPVTVYTTLFDAIFGSAYGFGQVLFKATTLIGTGLAVAVAFRAGLFNIGAEGQMYLAGLASAAFALALGDGCPALVAVPLVLLAGALAGALVALLPALLRAFLGVHEVINTIMLNFVAFALGSWILVEKLALFESVHTAEIPAAARLPRLETMLPAFRGAPLNLALLLQLLLCALCALALWRTRWGYEVRAVGLSESAARSAGIPVRRRLVEAMALSGALAGTAAANFVQGYKYYFEEGFTAEAGFKGIAVALLGSTHPAGIVPAALFFGALDRGGFVINGLVPKEFVDILQALVILLVIVLARPGDVAAQVRRLALRRREEVS
ncbi:MAG TPA: ABC transporter permease [Candidatus Krumholzibacteria bacterium]|nr:ABC transporter permease [Candidatus Krumholzibacteria bacterium]